MIDARYPIQMAARLSRLSAHVIRIWEQRYRAVEPHRTPGNRRLYSTSDIDRLNLLREASQAGHSIGQIAQLPVAQLRELAVDGAAAGAFRKAPAGQELPEPLALAGSLIDQSLAATRALDIDALDGVLKRGATELGAMGMLRHVIGPLAHALGEQWREGLLTAAHEHFASGAIRQFLGNLAQPFAVGEQAPVVVVATPAGQLHELGALLVAAAANHFGWRVTYLGASLPAAEIAGAARQRQARAVALSLVYPEDDPRLAGELATLRELLPAGTALLVGGRAMAGHRPMLAKLGAHLLDDLAQLGTTLDTLRQPEQTALP